jgi:hypothetical protein
MLQFERELNGISQQENPDRICETEGLSFSMFSKLNLDSCLSIPSTVDWVFYLEYLQYGLVFCHKRQVTLIFFVFG